MTVYSRIAHQSQLGIDRVPRPRGKEKGGRGGVNEPRRAIQDMATETMMNEDARTLTGAQQPSISALPVPFRLEYSSCVSLESRNGTNTLGLPLARWHSAAMTCVCGRGGAKQRKIRDSGRRRSIALLC